MLVERKDIWINGIDFTSFFGDTGYIVQYVRVQGSNGGMMQDGTTLLDTLKRPAVVTLPTYLLNEERLSTLLSEILDDYITLYYYDPWKKAYRTINAIPGEPSVKYRGRGADANSYWRGETISLTEN